MWNGFQQYLCFTLALHLQWTVHIMPLQLNDIRVYDVFSEDVLLPIFPFKKFEFPFCEAWFMKKISGLEKLLT